PGFELVPGIGEFTQIALQTGSEVIVVGCNLKCAQANFQRAVTDAGGEFGTRRRGARDVEYRRYGRNSASGRVVRYRERVECVLSRHADPSSTNSECMSAVRPDIGGKWGRRQTAIPELPEIFEVGKYGQVFVADIAIERTVQIFTIRWRNVRRQISE